MKKSLVLILLMSLCSFHLHGQITIRGLVLEAKTKKPISYANFGIIKSRIGSLSDNDGRFSIEIPENHKKMTH